MTIATASPVICPNPYRMAMPKPWRPELVTGTTSGWAPLKARRRSAVASVLPSSTTTISKSPTFTDKTSVNRSRVWIMQPSSFRAGITSDNFTDFNAAELQIQELSEWYAAAPFGNPDHNAVRADFGNHARQFRGRAQYPRSVQRRAGRPIVVDVAGWQKAQFGMGRQTAHRFQNGRIGPIKEHSFGAQALP